MKLCRKFALTSFACAFALAASGCATRLTEVKAKSPQSCPFHQSKDGLSFGLEPITDKETLTGWFGKDITTEGLLPLLVVVENHNPSNSFLISKERILLTDATADRTATSTRGALAVEPPGASVAAASLLVGPFAFLGPVTDAQVRQHNLAEREFATRTISPNEHANGFVYYQFTKGTKPPNAYRVILNALLLGTNQTVSIALDVNLPKSTP
jgi:hypothetical protein